MSTLSSANVTDVNLVLKERTHKIKIKYSMHQYSIFMHILDNWLMLLLLLMMMMMMMIKMMMIKMMMMLRAVLMNDRAAASLRSEDCMRWMTGTCSSSTDIVELNRLIHCAAYNVLTAVISCTQSELNFYTGFLFPSDNLAKVSALLSSLPSHSLPSSRQHLSYDVCLEVRGETVLCCTVY